MEKVPMELAQLRQALTQVIVRKKLKDKLSDLSKEPRVPRWYFGGLASAGAACITHPLDTMKVYYQTSGSLAGNQSLWAATIRVIKTNGFFSLYNGLSASILRQLTYSTTRFAIYELTKQELCAGTTDHLPLYKLMAIAGLSGAAGGLVGAPADVVNVRMQNDIKFPAELKRNYRNCIHGLRKILKTEGFNALFQGSSMALARSVVMSIGQLAMYDQYKYLLVSKLNMPGEDIKTHVTSSVFTSLTCTAMTQPLDVLKTRMMNQSASHKQNICDAVQNLYCSSGLSGFYRGFVPALVRLGPQTVLVFVFYEQLRIHFGIRTTE